MARISDFTEEQYVDRFVIEPPIEVGDQIISTLGRLAAIGGSEPSAAPGVVDELAEETDRTAATLYLQGGVNALSRYLTNVASRRTPHTFFTSTY